MILIQVSLCLIVIAILASFIYKLKHKRLYKLVEQFPWHPTYPLIGNIPLLIGSNEGLLGRLEKIMQSYDRLIVWIGPVPILFLKKHDDIATIHNQCLNRDSYDMVDGWLGTGVLSAGYEEWKKSRRILTPGFTSNMISKYVQVFNQKGLDLVEKLKPVADAGREIDVLKLMMIANLEVATETTLGIAIRGKQGDDFCNAMLEGFKHGIRRTRWGILIFRPVNEIYLKVTGNGKVIDHVKQLPGEALRNNIKNYRDSQPSTSTTCKNNDDSSQAMIDLLVKNGLEGGFTETRMRDELLQIIIAGVETSALTTSFLLLMLAINQDVQQKVYEEVTQPTADDDTLSETRLNDHLQYLEQCIRETLRMFSPVMINIRHTHRDIALKDNTIVPNDTYVLTFTHLAHYDPDLYANPQNWDPEHFSSEAVQQRPKTGELSFGYGPRICMGVRYSMMSIKTQIVHILRNYHLSTSVKEFTKNDLIADLGIKSKIGYPIRFTRRREK